MAMQKEESCLLESSSLSGYDAINITQAKHKLFSEADRHT